MATANSTVPGWEKGLIILGGGILAAVVLHNVVKAAKNLREQKGSREEHQATQDELAALNKGAGTKQTITPTQATSMANIIFTAMDGYGTDGITIMKQLIQLKNQADWLALSSAFGIREISSGKLNPTPNFKGTLAGAFADEFGVNDVPMQTKINELFKARGIKTVI